jgi:hypothetical protein
MLSPTITWYFENKEIIDNALGLVLIAACVAALWLVNQLSLDIPSPFNLIILIAATIPSVVGYFGIKMWIRRCFLSSVRHYSSRFRVQPEFAGKVGEKLVDRVDIKILEVIRDVGGRFSSFVPETAEMLPVSELLRRLGRLHALGYVRMYKDKALVTSEGLELLDLHPLSLRTNIPPQVASNMAKTKMNLSAGRYDAVIVNLSKTLESILKDTLEPVLAGLDEKKVKEINLKPYAKWTLGDLKGAASKLNFLDKTADNILNSIIQIRNRSIHASQKGLELDPETAALSMMSLSEAFVRYWYSGQQVSR